MLEHWRSAIVNRDDGSIVVLVVVDGDDWLIVVMIDQYLD